MSQQTLNLGTTGSVSGGDNLQVIFTKCESNFIELYDHVSNYNNPHETTAAQVSAVALNLLGVANGVATLGSDARLTPSQAPILPYYIHAFYPSVPVLNQTILVVNIPVNVVFPIDFATGAYSTCIIAGRQTCQLTVYQNSTIIGYLNFANGATTGTFATVSGSAISFSPGDSFSVIATNVDSYISGIAFTLTGTLT